MLLCQKMSLFFTRILSFGFSYKLFKVLLLLLLFQIGKVFFSLTTMVAGFTKYRCSRKNHFKTWNVCLRVPSSENSTFSFGEIRALVHEILLHELVPAGLSTEVANVILQLFFIIFVRTLLFHQQT